MSIQMNRVLDVLASYAIVALGLALAGATAIVGIRPDASPISLAHAHSAVRRGPAAPSASPRLSVMEMSPNLSYSGPHCGIARVS